MAAMVCSAQGFSQIKMGAFYGVAGLSYGSLFVPVVYLFFLWIYALWR